MAGYVNLDTGPCSKNNIQTSQVEIMNQTNVADYYELHINNMVGILAEIDTKYTSLEKVQIIPVDDGL